MKTKKHYPSDELKQVLVRMPADLHARLKALAEKEDRALNSQVVRLLKQGLETQKKAA